MNNLKTFIISGASLIAGTIFGYQLNKSITKSKTKYCGNLRLDNSDPNESTKLFLELTTDLDSLVDSKTVIFKVVKENYVRQ